ncbi:M20 family metallopeptidase [Fusobacterium perfoetens]|uniref:M20 family metallopeptidase n=1 Tax=Fusobacterium perfoetens TaxID=852 RepID=UPI000488BFF0|nr:M20 family metallopeptidase [Fusobacterium perfoetens]
MKNYDKILEELNGKIWDYSELKFNEYKSSNDMIEILKNENFIIKKGLAGMDTAFTATFGSGKPVIGILGEFDALSGLSQKPGEDKPVPREETKNGHGCGHCLLGTAGIGAVLMVRDFLVENNREGTIVFIGCPGEEGGSGKAYLAREGVFDNLDIALTWHPAGGNAVITGSFQANCQVYFKFKGVSSHAAGSPHLGRSALDAVELMNVGVNYLREHIEPTDRIHYAVLDTGGTSPNVVQSHAKVLYLIRSTDTEKVKKLYERVCKVAKGAALMTETEVEIVFDKACSNVISNSILEDVLYETMKEISLPDYDEKDLEFAEKIKKTITDVDRNSDMSLMFVSNFRRKELANRYKEILMSDFVVEHTHQDINIPGSSDVGDCSHVVPTAQFSGACFVPGTPAHSWQMVSQGKEGIAVKGMLYASKVLAKSVERLIKNPQLIEKAKEEFNKVTEKKAYSCPIPIEVKPDILGNR